MKVNSITSNLINYYSGSSKPVVSNINSSDNSVQTSIYNDKGVTLPFCGMFKSLNSVEESCAKFLRKQREGRCRKFSEFDINDIMISLRKEKNPNTMEKFLNDITEALDGTDCDRNTYKRIINLTAGKSDDEQYVLLAFADHELKNASEPLKAFTELSAEKREKLVPFLQKIYTSEASEETTSALYDTFRTLVYAYEDMAKLNGAALNNYKVDTCKMLRENIEYFEKQPDKNAVSIAKEIYHYFTDNMI